MLVLILLAGGGYWVFQNSEEDRAKEHYLRAVTLQNEGELESAISEYTKVLNIDRRFTEAYSNRGVARMDLGQYDKAVEDFSNAILQNPLIPYFYYNRGLAFERAGAIDFALLDYLDAVDIDPTYRDAFYGLGIGLSGVRRLSAGDLELRQRPEAGA